MQMWIEALSDLKKASGKTTKQIAELSGVPIGTLNKLFAGQTKDPKLDTITAVVHALGYTLDDLVPKQESPETAEAESRDSKTISLEESNRLLTALGYIKEGRQLTDDDLAFLSHIIGLLDAWFGQSH